MSLKKWFLEPEYSVRLHAWATVLWFGLGTPATLLWLSDSVAWVSWMSLYAIVVAHWSTFQASRAEKRVKRGETPGSQ